jgi:hypothetical protein
MKPVAIMERRPRAEIVDDIVAQLRPLKRGVDAARADILVNIEKIVPMIASTRVWNTAVRRKAARATNALALEKDIPAFGGFDFGIVRTALEGIAYSKGPDPRFSYLHWICAHQSCVLAESHSKKPPVTSENGNLHLVAQLFFEAVTGEPSSKTGLLRAVKKVKNWRERPEHISHK